MDNTKFKDPFNVLALFDEVEPVRYGKDWAAVERWGVDYGQDPNSSGLLVRGAPPKEWIEISVREALEYALHFHACLRTFHERYPARTRNQLTGSLKSLKAAVRRLRKAPLVVTYAADIGAAFVLDTLDKRLQAIEEAIRKGAALPIIEPDVRISRIRLSDWLHLEACRPRLAGTLPRASPGS
jgi:hypothetical protein